MKVLKHIFLSIIIVFSSCRKVPDEDNTSTTNLFENNNHGVFEFTSYYFPNSTSYQLGYIRDFNGNFTNEDIWTFSLIEPVFDMIKNNLDYSGNKYNMFGHSAGAQFVHRYIQFKPNSRINKAVSANAGWYTLPDTSISFPYGLKGSSINSNNLENSFLKNLEIHLGQNDNNPNDPFLNTTDGANLQGNDRLSRGKYFILNSDSIAQNMNFSSNWIKKEVPNVGHQQVNMAAFAAQELF